MIHTIKADNYGGDDITDIRDFVSRVTHRLLVSTAKTPGKGTILAEFSDSLGLPTHPTSSWSEPLRSLLPGGHTWSVCTDASWRAKQALQAQAVFGTQGTHEGCGALFLSADSPDWCSHIAAARFDIPPTSQALGGTAQVAELLAIYEGLFLLSTLNLRGTIYSDCLAAVKKITRRWTPGRAFQDAGAALVIAGPYSLPISPSTGRKATQSGRTHLPPPGPDGSGASTWRMP